MFQFWRSITELSRDGQAERRARHGSTHTAPARSAGTWIPCRWSVCPTSGRRSAARSPLARRRAARAPPATGAPLSAVATIQEEYRLNNVLLVPYDIEVCRAYAGLFNLKNVTGSDRVLPANDRWIAACALRHSIPLITHNHRDFDGIPNLNVISEADPAPTPKTGDLFEAP